MAKEPEDPAMEEFRARTSGTNDNPLAKLRREPNSRGGLERPPRGERKPINLVDFLKRRWKILARVVAVGAVAVFAFLNLAEPTESLVELQVGECLDDVSDHPLDSLSAGTIESEVRVRTKDCADPHEAQVYFVDWYYEGEYPGTSEMDTIADQLCSAELDPDAIAWDGVTDIFYGYYYPTADGWRDSDRRITCVLLFGDREYTGNVLVGGR